MTTEISSFKPNISLTLEKKNISSEIWTQEIKIKQLRRCRPQ